MRKIIFALLTLFFALPAMASDVEMADQMRADGKIYVVIAVLVTILLGLFVFVIRTDFKVSELEKKLKGK